MKKEVVLVMGEIPREELITYFVEIGGSREEILETSESLVIGDYWAVRIGLETVDPIASIRIRRVNIHFSVETSEFEHFLKNFRKAFLRAGG